MNRYQSEEVAYEVIDRYHRDGDHAAREFYQSRWGAVTDVQWGVVVEDILNDDVVAICS